jgi:hypothetical protein
LPPLVWKKPATEPVAGRGAAGTGTLDGAGHGVGPVAGAQPFDEGGVPLPLEVGAEPLEVGAEPLEVGAEPLEVGAEPLEVGAEPLEVGAEPLEVGAEPLEVGAEPLDVGAEPLDVGAEPLDVGAEPLDVGAEPLDVGAEPLEVGAQLLGDGAEPPEDGAELPFPLSGAEPSAAAILTAFQRPPNVSVLDTDSAIARPTPARAPTRRPGLHLVTS